jgi:predicted HicB family RNase H-like nuclease
MGTAQQESKITVRIPAEIAALMRQLAKRNDRSLNGELVRALREYTERHQGEK